MSDTRVAAACLRVLQAVVAAVGDARDAGAAHEVSDKVCRLVAKQKMHVDAVFAWASYSSSMVMSPSSAVMAPSHVAHGGGVSGGVGPPNGTGNSNNNANGQVQGRNGGDGSSFDGVAAASGRCTAAAATGSAAVRNVFAVSNVHNSVGPGGGVGGGGGGGYVPGQVMMNIDLNCDTHGHEFSKRAALRRRCLTKARTKRQQQRQKNQARKPHLTSAAQQNVDTSNSNNENVNMNMNIKAADPMVVDSVVGHKDDTRLHRAKVWDENNVIDDDEDEDEDDNDNFLDEYDIDDGDVDDDMAQCDGILPLLHSGVVCGGGAVPGNASGGLVVQVADGATATAAAVGGAAEGVGRTSALPSLTSMSPAVAAATTAMSTASSTSVQCEALQLIEAVTGLLMERDRNHHHLVCQQNEKRKQHVPSSPSPSNSGTGDKGKATGDNDNEGDGDKDGDDSSVDAMWAFVERGYDVVCDVLLHGARDDASIEAALGMLALAAMYAPYLITDYGGIDGVCAMLARLFWWLQHTDEGHVSGGGGDFNSSIGCCWDRQTVVAMLKACVHVLVLVAPALNASRNKIDVNGPVRLTGLGVLAALAWPRQGLGATPAEFVMQDDDDLGDGGVDEGTGNGNADANDEEAKKFASDGNDVGGDKADEDAGQKQQQRQQNKNKNKKNKVNDRNGGPDVGGFGSQFVQDCQKAWTLLYRRTKNK